MILIVLVILLSYLLTLKINFKLLNKDYLSKDNTKIINGILLNILINIPRILFNGTIGYNPFFDVIFKIHIIVFIKKIVFLLDFTSILCI